MGRNTVPRKGIRPLRGFQTALFEDPQDLADWQEDYLQRLDQLLGVESKQKLSLGGHAEQLYESLGPGQHRKDLGQFFTPPQIARFMANWVLDHKPRSLLDPAVGLGVFLDHVLALKPKPMPSLTAYDIDPVMVEGTRRILSRLGSASADLHHEDLILSTTSERFDSIVGNPPYVRHHTLEYSADVFDEMGRRAGAKLSRLTNIYGLFMIRCFELLSSRGRYALITPSEFLNADFGVQLKEFLLKSGKLSALVLFDHNALVFDGALTTACITMVDMSRSPEAPVRLVKVSHLEQLPEVLGVLRERGTEKFHRNGWKFQAVPGARLDPTTKWDPLFEPRRPRVSKHLVRLGSLATSMRGIATGANNFFTLSDEERKSAGLTLKELKPCITKATTAPYLDYTDDDFEALRHQGSKVFLIDFGPALSSAASQYIAHGEQQGLHLRFLTAVRSPWYSGEKRPPAPILVTVFARGGFRFVYNRAMIPNLTAFHCLYPRSLSEVQTKALMAYLCSRTAARLLDQEKRVYGDGLIKLEPRDLLNLPVLDVRTLGAGQLSDLAKAFDALCAVRRKVEDWRTSKQAKRVETLIALALRP